MEEAEWLRKKITSLEETLQNKKEGSASQETHNGKIEINE
jgi:hypothetical protein